MSEPEEKNTIVQNTPVSDSVVMVNRRLHSKVENRRIDGQVFDIQVEAVAGDIGGDVDR